MKYYLIAALLLLLSGCTPQVYQRPVTIDRLEVVNTAGQSYQAQFQRVNGWLLRRIDSLGRHNGTLAFDTLRSPKRYRPYNHTLVASLEQMNIEGKAGVYYQLYLRPNSGTGKLKGGVQQDIYNELKLFSPEHLFLQHTHIFYRDSIVVGPFKRLLPVATLLPAQNSPDSSRVSVSLESITFPKSLKKRQREGLLLLINNSIVRGQAQTNASQAQGIRRFNYYNNVGKGKDRSPATYNIKVAVTEDVGNDRLTVQLHCPGVMLPKWQATSTFFSRRDYLKGYTYQANQHLNSLPANFVQALLYREPK